ncbi:MAG: hypothetical protein ACK56F_08810, partial [bacterium]
MEQNGRLDPETGGERKPLAKGLLGPAQALLGRQGSQLLPDRRQVNRPPGAVRGKGGSGSRLHQAI